MHYQKIHSEKTVIEFHNNWLGEETVIVRGKVVSKQSSIWGISHVFEVQENGATVRFVLTSKLDANMNVLLDLRRNGVLVEENLPVMLGYGPTKVKNPKKQQGIQRLREYRLEEALEHFQGALEVAPDDPEIYFHLACAYSVLERPLPGFEALQAAVEHGLSNPESILEHDMLAFLRLHPAFENFFASGFQRFDATLFS